MLSNSELLLLNYPFLGVVADVFLTTVQVFTQCLVLVAE
jgi:hypothetical protein